MSEDSSKPPSKTYANVGIWLMATGAVGWMLVSVIAGLKPGFPGWASASLHALAIMVAVVGGTIWVGEAGHRRHLERVHRELVRLRQRRDEADVHLYREVAGVRIAVQDMKDVQERGFAMVNFALDRLSQGVAQCSRSVDAVEAAVRLEFLARADRFNNRVARPSQPDLAEEISEFLANQDRDDD